MLGLAVGGILRLLGLPGAASLAWALTTALGIAPCSDLSWPGCAGASWAST
jgi:hypothetical protein